MLAKYLTLYSKLALRGLRLSLPHIRMLLFVFCIVGFAVWLMTSHLDRKLSIVSSVTSLCTSAVQLDTHDFGGRISTHTTQYIILSWSDNGVALVLLTVHKACHCSQANKSSGSEKKNQHKINTTQKCLFKETSCLEQLDTHRKKTITLFSLFQENWLSAKSSQSTDKPNEYADTNGC